MFPKGDATKPPASKQNAEGKAGQAHSRQPQMSG